MFTYTTTQPNRNIYKLYFKYQQLDCFRRQTQNEEDFKNEK